MVVSKRSLTSFEYYPIERITPKFIVIAEYSGKAMHPDGRVERIGVRKLAMLNRRRLENGEEIWRRGACYRLAWIVKGMDVSQTVEDFLAEQSVSQYGDLSDGDKVILHLLLMI